MSDLTTPGPAAPPPPAAASRRGRIGLLAVLLLIVAALGGYWLWRGDGTGAPGARAAAAPPLVTVSQPLQREITEWDEFTGQFAAVEFVEIRSRVSGYLDSVGFQDGQI